MFFVFQKFAVFAKNFSFPEETNYLDEFHNNFAKDFKVFCKQNTKDLKIFCKLSLLKTMGFGRFVDGFVLALLLLLLLVVLLLLLQLLSVLVVAVVVVVVSAGLSLIVFCACLY